MIEWNERPEEIKYLLNPAFCARIIYSALEEYEKISSKSMPVALIYLILPLILHKSTRERINSKISFTNWAYRDSNLLIGFSRRAKEMVSFTNEAIEFLLQSRIIILNSNGYFEINKILNSLSKTKYTDEEVYDCIKKAEHVARWFWRTGKVETVYIILGVRP